MFRTLIYPLSEACDYSVELPHWTYCSWFDVCWSFGVVGLEWYPCCRLKHNWSVHVECWRIKDQLYVTSKNKRPTWCHTDTTPNQLHRNSNTHRTNNNMTNVVIQQNNRKLLMMDILMSETCSVHKKWNKIASDINLVFYSSTITMMHGPINVRCRRIIQHLKENIKFTRKVGIFFLQRMVGNEALLNVSAMEMPSYDHLLRHKAVYPHSASSYWIN